MKVSVIRNVLEANDRSGRGNPRAAGRAEASCRSTS